MRPPIAYLVEYPGVIRDSNAALHTLGGEDGVTVGFSTATEPRPGEEATPTMALRFRPDNPSCHPIMGTVISCPALVCTVRRSRRRDTGQVVGIETTVDAAIDKICRFRSIADYQVHMDLDAPVPVLLRSIHELDLEKVKSFSLWNHNASETAPTSPVYSTVRVPFRYDFKQNPVLQKVVVRRDGEGEDVRLVNRQRAARQVVDIPVYKYGDKVPEFPPADLPQVSRELLEKVEKLFAGRPIWTRCAIANELGKTEPDIRYAMSKYGYFVSNGPWRSSYIRYGCDPRHSAEYRIYQILDFRTNPLSKVASQTAASTAVARSMPLSAEKLIPKAKFTGSFSAEYPLCHQITGLYQLCDIEEPTLQRLIHLENLTRSECDEKFGWYNQEQLRTVRRFMKHIVCDLSNKEEKLAAQLQGQAPPAGAIIQFELEEHARAEVEQQLEAHIRQVGDRKRSDRDVLEDKLDRLMNALASVSGATAVNVVGGGEEEDVSGEEDLEYDIDFE